MRTIKPAILFALIFGGIAILSFHPNFERSEKNKIGKYHVIIPEHMPANDGLYWATKKGDEIIISPYNSREYQVELDIDSTEIWDGDRFVGKIPYDSASKFDLLMTKDNQ